MDDGDVGALKAQIAALTAAVQALAGRAGPQRADVTVAELAKRYAVRAAPGAMAAVGPFVAYFGDQYVSSLRKADYLHFRDDVRAQRLTVRRRAPAIGTLNEEHSRTVAMLRWGVRNEITQANPLEGIRKLKGQRSRETEIGVAEHERAFADAPLLVRVFQTTCFETGARSGCEVRRMERPHVDEFRSLIHFPRENVKGKTRARDVPMSDYLRDLLREMPVVLGSPFIFANPATKLPYTAKHLATLSRPYLDRLKAAPGDGRVVTHDTRHSAVSRLARGGLNPMAGMKIIGHASASQHWRYLHVSEQDKAAAKRLLDSQRPSRR